MTASVALPLRIGARTLWQLRRRLVRRGLSLAEALGGELPDLPALPPGADGYLVNAVPAHLAETLGRRLGLRAFARQRYQRSYARLDQSFDAYLGGFSAKSRSTLKRKVRKLAQASGGTLDLRSYRTPAEIEDFYHHARAVSATTYQERLLGAGLPEGEEALARMLVLAGQDLLRGWVLFLSGRPISYLHTPAAGDTLIYAHLGYDPEFADLSPGTVLQFEAMRHLMDERRFTLFDFTEGEGQHKRQFGTGSVECVDLLLVRPTLTNLLTGHLLNGFDTAVALAKKVAARLGVETIARRLRR